MRARTAVFGTLGMLATGVGVGLLLAPGLLRGLGPVDAAVTALSATETTTVGLAAGTLALVALLVTARSGSAPERVSPSRADSRFERAATAPPEEATASGGSLTASGLDNDVRQAVETGGDHLRDVRSLLRETATSAYAEQMGVPEEEAADVVDCGEWTDDPVAARFLAAEPLGLSMRVRHWLVPQQERERRVERTVAAIERVASR
jgi:hypothetical protein